MPLHASGAQGSWPYVIWIGCCLTGVAAALIMPRFIWIMDPYDIRSRIVRRMEYLRGPLHRNDTYERIINLYEDKSNLADPNHKITDIEAWHIKQILKGDEPRIIYELKRWWQC